MLRALAAVALGAAPTACAAPIFWIGVIAAVGIGMSNAGNDLCNAMGVTVGAGVLSLRQAVGVGALFDGLGGLLMGSRVTNTIAAGIVKRDLYSGVDGPDLLAKSMLVVMGSGGLTMLTGTMCKVPISAHHSVVGSLVAMALLTRGPEAVEWWLVGQIVFSWIGNPLLGMACSMVSFGMIDYAILSAHQPVAAFHAHKWLIYALSMCACLPFVLVMSPQLKLPLAPALFLSCSVGLLGARYAATLSSHLAAAHAYARAAGGKGHTPTPSEQDEEGLRAPPVGADAGDDDDADDGDDDDDAADDGACARMQPPALVATCSSASTELQPMIRAEPSAQTVVGSAGSRAHRSARAARKVAAARLHESEVDAVEALFGPLLVLSAVSVAFVHGAQDVSNSAGPLMQLNAVLSSGAAASRSTQWPLLLAVCAFVAGDLTLGWRVIGTVGSEITDMTPSRAFAAQMGTVVALTSATLVSLPVSSSECIIGSVIGVGLAKRYLGYADGGVELSVLRRIWTAWVLTIPYAGSIATCLFLLLNAACPFSGASGASGDGK
ncbi:hypothetical protein KFE25_001685 [Diacronema lutheri]|uniref:Phosphate transporter n=2 Tax=Diacronema lutheri TaxID=2081491 RepID=A0A8J5XFI6_DIALT|nr:hypothetical protein KFE25_001685 [Diacronema lutheri]